MRALACLLAVGLLGLAGCQRAPDTLPSPHSKPEPPASASNAEMPPPVPPAVQTEARALLGLQNTPQGFIGKVPNLACEHLGDAGQADDAGNWSYKIFICKKHTVIALAQNTSGSSDQTVQRIVDVLALPEILPPLGQPDPEPFPWRLSGHLANDGCEVEGYANDKMPAVFGLSRRQELPVVKLAQAWTFDFAQGKIVPFDPAKVDCDYVEP